MIKINFFDHCPKGVSHKDICSGGVIGLGAAGKKSKTVEFMYDDSGILDLYTKHHFDHIQTLGKSDIKVGWLTEAITVDQTWYNKLKQKKDYYFDELGFNYIYTYNQDLLDLDSRFKWSMPGGIWIEHPQLYAKTKMLSMITSNKKMCAMHTVRLQWVDKLKNDLDLYGMGFNQVKFKEEALSDYMFSVVIENDWSDNAISEKLLDCFATGTIPIYGGTKTVSKFFNTDGIIYLENDFDPKSLTEDLYYSKLDAIKNNLEFVQQYEIPIDNVCKEIFSELKIQ
jgi:hypothetical protein